MNVTYRHLEPGEARAATNDLVGVYAAVFSEPPYNEGPDAPGRFAGWLAGEATEPGFDLVTACDDQGVVGFAYGYTMLAGRWWHGADRAAPPQVAAAATFAVMEWAVLPAARGRGVGRRLMDELLAGRPERYATLMVNPAADARTVYERWGWQQVAATKPGRAGSMDVMLLDLRQVGARRIPAGTDLD